MGLMYFYRGFFVTNALGQMSGPQLILLITHHP